ncbi:spry domain-containing protein, partial [Cystoisospora suis]
MAPAYRSSETLQEERFSSSSSSFSRGLSKEEEKRLRKKSSSSSSSRSSSLLAFLTNRLLWRPSSGPLALNCRRHPHYIKILKDGLSALYTARGDYTDVGVVQADRPVASNCALYYFEVEILNCSSSPRICVGLTPKSACLTKQPGIEPNSIGYRSEDGRKLSALSGNSSSSLVSRGGGGSAAGEVFASSYGCKDVIGCGVHHLSRNLFFTKNGVFVGIAGKLDTQIEYYPSVGMHATDEKVRFNFTGPFVFDLPKLLQ